VAHGWQLQAVARLDCSLPLVFRFAFSSLHYQASSPSTLPIPVLLISLPCFKLPCFLPFSFSISFSPFLPSHSSFLCFKTSLPFQFQKIPLSPSKLYLSSFTSHLPVVLALLGPLAPFSLCFFPVPLSFVQKNFPPLLVFQPPLSSLSLVLFKKTPPSSLLLVRLRSKSCCGWSNSFFFFLYILFYICGDPKMGYNTNNNFFSNNNHSSKKASYLL
jgi:hypothetical protein